MSLVESVLPQSWDSKGQQKIANFRNSKQVLDKDGRPITKSNLKNSSKNVKLDVIKQHCSPHLIKDYTLEAIIAGMCESFNVFNSNKPTQVTTNIPL